ncbi:SgcJ/EcaC family oxidoreductase [Hymenobacter sp. HDW8]|uniref:SgcJ/EcaC family oxidoreductase n=1 Tax=Hymenobacter sp. HDW8 TaxID=2714932 RepID=UPI0014073C74|nr:SgcJ/EcaC family oxidoreductase [Hymenobacter sp. HDW8]QIL77387.1 SgcJ/EcaC family oxidoreductase [Hymenobacter sp. HDW8]
MKKLLSLLLILCLAAAAHAQTTTTKYSADEKAVLQVNQGIAEAWNKHDTDLYFSYFAPDAQWVNVVGMWWRNAAEHKYALDIFMKVMFNKTKHNILHTEVRMLRPDLALVRHNWELEGWVMPDGRDMSDVSTGVMTLMLEKRKGKWLVIDGHNTSIDKKAQDPVLTMKK